jgi:hypothetical protein
MDSSLMVHLGRMSQSIQADSGSTSRKREIS